MLSWALGFFVVAIIAAIFGFGGVATAFAGVAQLLFYLFVILFVISLVLSLVNRPGIHVDGAAPVVRGGGMGPLGLLVFVALIAIGVYAWVDNGMSAERVGQIIDHSVHNMSADASHAIDKAGDRTGDVVGETAHNVRDDASSALHRAGERLHDANKN